VGQLTTHSPSRLALPPLVAVLRAASAARLPEVCEVLYAEGLRAFEFTLTTPGATAALKATRIRLPHDAVLGIGTVLTLDDVDGAADAGADFLVSPIFSPAALSRAIDLDVPFVPGTNTPTEAYTAWQSGAAMVKLWPVNSMGGPSYVRALLQVFPGLALMPSGGIAEDDVAGYLDVGATAVGLGGGFQGDAADPAGDLDALAARARKACSNTPPIAPPIRGDRRD
jgi:2-dehydro-3-deoxyphosphogluconate aldolase/(4S)-4-hydroxy-2-oxoglutarate aldolase